MPKPRTLDRKILPEDLPRIISLFREGNTKTDIGNEYGVDHSTIYYHLVKAGVLIPIPGKKDWRRSLKRVTPLRRSDPYPADLNEAAEGPICRGKTYKEYLVEARHQDRRTVIHILCGRIVHKTATIEG